MRSPDATRPDMSGHFRAGVKAVQAAAKLSQHLEPEPGSALARASSATPEESTEKVPLPLSERQEHILVILGVFSSVPSTTHIMH